jgi:ABC-type polysaccharide/polyol phosphate transport system ATPase subunit
MLSNEVALSGEALSKRYMLRAGGAQQLKAAVRTLPAMLLKREAHHSFWALQDISFTVRRGESFGIAGANGSGKSTLLRVLGAVTKPTSGTLTTNGRVSTLLDLGAGFHPQITGRENALLNAVLLGLSLREAREVLPQIIEFSELGEFIDQPMRMYSSGMYVRLGFAVAVHVQPEILVLDEVLAVGDAEFQSKCFGHMQRLRESGVTVVFASHDLPSLQRYTDRMMLLEHGRTVLEGRPAEVIHSYLTRVFGPTAKAGAR